MGTPPQPKGSPRTSLGLAILKPLVDAYKADLAALGEAGVIRFVDEARTCTRWPSTDWLRDHWEKHWGAAKTAKEYADWVQDVKSRSTTQVWAFVHISTRKRSIAFVDPTEGAVVWVDTETMENVSAFYENTASYLAGKDFDYWRLEEAEL